MNRWVWEEVNRKQSILSTFIRMNTAERHTKKWLQNGHITSTLYIHIIKNYSARRQHTIHDAFSFVCKLVQRQQIYHSCLVCSYETSFQRSLHIMSYLSHNYYNGVITVYPYQKQNNNSPWRCSKNAHKILFIVSLCYFIVTHIGQWKNTFNLLQIPLLFSNEIMSICYV